MSTKPHLELRWQPLDHLRYPHRTQPPKALRSWLADSGSLTARLIAASEGQFHVKVIRQYISRPSHSEQQALGLTRPTLALIREVVLYGRHEPWIFARSVLPLSSLTGTLRHLRKQGAKPLGAFLFSHPQLLRSPIAITAMSRHHQYVPTPYIGEQPLWGRRSIFYLTQKPLLVSEVFLEAFCAHLA